MVLAEVIHQNRPESNAGDINVMTFDQESSFVPGILDSMCRLSGRDHDLRVCLLKMARILPVSRADRVSPQRCGMLPYNYLGDSRGRLAGRTRTLDGR